MDKEEPEIDDRFRSGYHWMFLDNRAPDESPLADERLAKVLRHLKELGIHVKP